MSHFIKKILSLALFLSLALNVFAPTSNSLVIFDEQPIKPFTMLIHAIGMVETNYDTLAYNPVEKAAGYFQIRPIRIKDYNRRTGNNYTLNDMFDYKVSEKIFLYYASKIGPYNFEQIAKDWNGSGPLTKFYWKRVKEYL